jgi:hypothetical protein
MNKFVKRILQGLLIISILIFLFGKLPDEVGFPSGLVWYLTKPSQTSEVASPNTELPTYAKDFIQITDFNSRRKIYYMGENATIDIKLYNPYSLEYTLSIYWIFNNSKFLGWVTQNNSRNEFYSWMPLNQKGDWISDAVINWTYSNVSFNTDKIVEIKVLD